MDEELDGEIVSLVLQLEKTIEKNINSFRFFKSSKVSLEAIYRI